MDTIVKAVGSVDTVSTSEAVIDWPRRETRWVNYAHAGLSEMETAILRYLIVHRDRTISREELLQQVWGIGTAGLTTRAVDMHIARLRAKLKDPARTDQTDHSETIITVRARGYRAGPGLEMPDEIRHTKHDTI